MIHHLTAEPPRHVATARPPLLRLALRENAAFSAVTGVFLVVAGGRIDDWIGLDRWLLTAAGAGLAAYAALLWLGSRDGAGHAGLARTGRAAVVADLSWVVGAVGITLGSDLLTGRGEVALLLLSVPVAVLAIAQTLGLRRLAGS